ncbi:MAG TPA: DCC1-like thiol-disulfide oxidoreductase family protein [Solirubrobacterales bacterium]|nr:DCC1-like thiol-disulfide oxidoreductase family protein [Solirubrobacterales bacterium]
MGATPPPELRWTVLYDGDCGLCKWLLAGLLRRDRARRLRPVSLQRSEAEALLADLDPAERMASWHLIDPAGDRVSAGPALPALLRLLPRGRLPASVLDRFPRFTSAGYRWVAEHRTGLSRFVPQRLKRRASARVRERELEEAAR